MSHRILQLLMGFVALSHLVTGLALMLAPSLQDQMAQLYGATVDWTPQMRYMMRPLGAFMLALGFVGLLATRAPARHPGIVLTFAGLLVIRVLQRVVFAGDITVTFGIETQRLWMTASFFSLLAVALIALLVASRGGQRPERV